MLKGRSVALVLALVACQVSAATAHLGRVRLQIPAPEGFVQVTPRMHRVDEVAKATVPATNVQLAVFIPEKDRQAALSDRLTSMSRNFRVQTIKAYIDRDVSQADFDHLKHTVDQGNKAMLQQLSAKVNHDLATRVGKKIDHISPGLALKLNGMYLMPVHARTRRTIAYSLMATVHGERYGHSFDKVVSGTATYVLVGKRVLFLYVYGSRDDLKWTRTRAAQWAKSVLAANRKGARKT